MSKILALKQNKYLLAFLDTEGGILETSLREISLIVKYIVKADKNFTKLSYETDTFHVLNLQISDENKSKSPNLKIYSTCLDFLLKSYKCEGVLCIAWNAKHDAKIIKTYFSSDFFYFIDGIAWAKRLTKFHSYKLSSIMDKYNMGKQKHGSFEDVLDMINVMKYIQVDYETGGKLSIEDLKIESNIQSSDEIFKRIINSNKFKPFSMENVPIKQDQDVYSFYEIIGEKYKIRNGFHKATSADFYRGYGLYEYDTLKNRYMLIKDKSKKNSVIKTILDKYFQ